MRFLLFVLLFISTSLFANIAKVSAVKGDVSALRGGETISLSLNSILEEKDIVETGKDGRVQIVFNDNTIISIGKNSTFDIQEYIYDLENPKESKVLFNVNKGIFKTITGQIGKLNPQKFKLKTKSASIGIRGTVFFVNVQPGKPEIYTCTEGQIEIVTPQGTVVLNAGEQTTVEFGEKPTKPEPITKENKAILEQNSGAKENEDESGQNEGTTTTTDTGTGTTTTTTTTTGTTTTTTTTTTTDTGTGTSIVVNTEDATDTATNASTDNTNDDKQTTVTSPSTDSSDYTYNLKTATYDLFASGSKMPKHDSTANGYIDDSSYYDKLETDPARVIITDGILNGSATLSSYQYSYMGEQPLTDSNGNGDNTDDEITITISDAYIGQYSTSYTGYTEYQYNFTNITTGTDLETFFYIDSMHEFFVQKVDKEIDNDYNYEFRFIFGEKTTTDHTIPTDGISKYEDLGDHTNDDYEPSSEGTYINWANKNILSYQIDDDDAFFIIGEVKDVGGYRTTPINFYRTSTNYAYKFEDVGTSNMYLYGSQYQGWGGEVKATDGTYLTLYTHGEFRDADFAGEDGVTPTSPITFNGFINSNSNSIIGDDFNLTIDRGSNITGGFNINDDINNELAINATLGSYGAYITDDKFAIIGSESDGTIQYGDSDIYGWLVAYDDGETADDQISWGFWGANLSTATGNITAQNNEYASAWIGIDESVYGKIDDILNSSFYSDLRYSVDPTANYSGSLLGTLEVAGVMEFIDPSSSSIDISFNFSNNTAGVTTVINDNDFNTALSSSDFSISADTYTIQNGTDSIKGSFYDGGEKTIGSFNLNDSTNSATAQGVFKATKQVNAVTAN